MNTCPLLYLCKCDGTQICLFCKILTVIFVALISGVIGYFIGNRTRPHKVKEQFRNDREKRSIEVTALGVINIIFFGLLGFLGFFWWVYNIIRVSPTWFGIAKVGLSNIQYFSLIAFAFLIPLIYIISGFGLLKLNEQARRITVLLGVCLTFWELIIRNLHLSPLLDYLLSTPKSMLTSTFRLIYYIIMIFYLTRPKVKEQFK